MWGDVVANTADDRERATEVGAGVVANAVDTTDRDGDGDGNGDGEGDVDRADRSLAAADTKARCDAKS